MKKFSPLLSQFLFPFLLILLMRPQVLSPSLKIPMVMLMSLIKVPVIGFLLPIQQVIKSVITPGKVGLLLALRKLTVLIKLSGKIMTVYTESIHMIQTGNYSQALRYQKVHLLSTT